MTTRRKNCSAMLWLASFLLTSGVWTYFGSSAFAQNAGTITVDTSNLIVRDSNTPINSSRGAGVGNLTINPGSLLLNPGAVTSTTTIGSVSGGNITISTGNIIIARSVPEPSFTPGLLALVILGAASIYKFKQKSNLI